MAAADKHIPVSHAGGFHPPLVWLGESGLFVALPSDPGISRVELETNRGEGFVTAKKICQSFPYSSIYLPTKQQQITASLNTAMRTKFGDGSSNCKYIYLDIENKDIVTDAASVIGTKCGILDICGEYYKPSNDEFGLQAQAIKNVIEAMRPLLVRAEGGRDWRVTPSGYCGLAY